MAKVYTEVLSGGQSYPVWDKAAHADITNLSGNFTAHSANNDMHTTTAEKAAWNAKLGPDALNNYYTKSETSGAEQISGALDALDQQFSAYIDSVAAAIAAGSAAGDWVDANGDTVLQAVTDVGTVSSDLESLYSTVTAHTADDDIHVTTSDKGRWDDYEGAITVLSGALDGLDTAVSDIQDRLTPVENDLGSLQGDVSNLQSSVESLESNVESLQSEVSTLQTDVSTLQDAVDGVQTDVSNLQGDVSTLQSDVSTLNERVDTVESELGNKADQSSLDDVVSSVDTITGDLESLTSTVNDHIADDDVHVTTADKDKWNSYDGAVSVLSGAIDELDDSVAELASALDAKADAADLENYVLNSDFDDYKTSVADDIASGVAAKEWIDNFTPTSPLTAGDFISIEDDVISVSGLDTLISGTDGISAKWDTATSGWNITLDKEEIAYARYTTNSVIAAAEAADVTITGLQEAELYGDKITSNTDSITLQPGLYHADVKLMLHVTTPSPKYEAVKLAAGFSPARSTEIDLDCSYVHNESVCLSFDAMVSDELDVDLSIENLPAGVGYTLSYFNIHEIVNVAGLLTSAQTAIVAGDGLSKDGNELAVKLGGGLKFDNNKNITIAVGNGLKISQSELTTDLELVLDDIAEETVQQVQELSNDLDEKVTTTYDYAGITTYSDMSQYGATTGAGVLIRYLFSVPIKNAIYVRGMNAEEAGKVTVVGVYASQSYTQKPIMFGIYEYNPEYKHDDGSLGRTVALCDTGPVTLKAGFNEFEMVHFNKYDETTPDLKSSCIYYAALYVSKNPGTGIDLATCPGYDVTFNANPQLTCDQSNVNFDLSADEDKDKHLDDMGWGAAAYHELPQCPRVFMQFRNKKIVE